MDNHLKSLHDSEMIQGHIKIMNDNKNRSESNTHRLNKHDEKIEELSKVHSALNGIQTEMKHLSKKIDEVKTDKEVMEKNNKLQSEQSKEFIMLIKEASSEIAKSNKKTWEDRIADWIVPVILISALYMILQALNAGII
ncbi:MAG: hypothetical protein ACQEQF_00720 [Bacillota bacterium]